MIGLRRSLPTCRLMRTTRFRNFSTPESTEVAVATTRTESTLLEGSDTASLGTINRHGPGDKIITLNVGGKEFTTLRSTVNSNSVLSTMVVYAEKNKELLKNGAVFVDRDPAYFDIILKHLRNRSEIKPVDQLKTDWKTFTRSNCLPEEIDKMMLRELYIEATYYKIPELQAALMEQKFLAKIFWFFGGTNPIDATNQALKQLRTGLLMFTTVSVSGATLAIQQNFDAFLKYIGWRPADYKPPEKEEPAKTAIAA
eukprot:scaffold3849_cov179-Amphora_coffeaeformis.AAC.13